MLNAAANVDINESLCKSYVGPMHICMYVSVICILSSVINNEIIPGVTFCMYSEPKNKHSTIKHLASVGGCPCKWL